MDRNKIIEKLVQNDLDRMDMEHIMLLAEDHLYAEYNDLTDEQLRDTLQSYEDIDILIGKSTKDLEDE
jgi:uncharacterized protein (DUF433 family)